MSSIKKTNPKKHKKGNARRFIRKPVKQEVIQLRSMVKQVMSQESKQPEPKHADLGLNTTITWGGSVFTIFAPAQGTGVSNRIGDRCYLRYVTINFTVLSALSSSARVLLIWDKQNTLFTASDAIGSSNVGTVMATLAPTVFDRRAEFDVIYDKVIDLSANGRNIITHSLRFGLNKHVFFQQGTSTVLTGALKIFYYTNTSTSITLHAHHRVIFTDE